ncbi:RNA polymerase sigma factor [Geodermatophilus sp. URMC 62]|uniref:RNA polymerase sigma factor n=1 Tax=Geodermatophilus sp. URMC 62 TaxID=3423414 RepID=UPI00406CC878
MHGPPPATDDPPVSAEERLEAAYRASGTAVLGYALRRAASREDALDVVAETFATAWRRRADLPPADDEVRPWLFGIARLCLANAARSSRRAHRLGERLAEAMTDVVVPDPAAAHEDGAQLRLVREALGRLSAEDRELVTLVAWEGLTPAQAAVALGIAPGTARVRLHRARTRLRAFLGTPDDVQEGDRDH